MIIEKNVPREVKNTCDFPIFERRVSRNYALLLVAWCVTRSSTKVFWFSRNNIILGRRDRRKEISATHAQRTSTEHNNFETEGAV